MIFRFGFDSRRKSKAVRLARLREYKCSVPTRPPVSLSRGGKVPPGVPSSFLPLNHCVSPLSISLAVSPPSRVEWGDKSILSSLKVAYPCSCRDFLLSPFFFLGYPPIEDEGSSGIIARSCCLSFSSSFFQLSLSRLACKLGRSVHRVHRTRAQHGFVE